MCVLVVKPSGTPMLPKYVLRAMSIANPHGCGYACKSGSFRSLDFETFYKRLSRIPEDENVIIHFRLATHGSVKVNNCHPFKANGVYFAHNGILDITPRGDMTDSETAFKDVLLPIIKKHDSIFTEDLKNKCNEIRGWSKFAFLKDGKVMMSGAFEKYRGCFVSNKRFLAYIPDTIGRGRFAWAFE